MPVSSDQKTTDEGQVSMHTPVEAVRGRSFIQRRVEHLLTLLRQDKLELLAVERHELARDLYNVQRHPNGSINVATCTPLVRSFASSLYALKDVGAGGEVEPSVHGDVQGVPLNSVQSVVEVQREFFTILEEFFHRFTGEPSSQFASLSTFDEEYKRKGAGFNPNAMLYLRDALSDFYGAHSHNLQRSAELQGGAKFLLESSRFPAPAVRAMQSMLLYSDTIVVPDPILPWLEVDRREEQFPITWTLRTAFFLLALKPVVDADLPYPAVLVVPTFDRSSIMESEEAQELLSRFYLKFFSSHLGFHFEDESEIFEYSRSRQADFLQIVDRKGLFYPPEGSGTESVAEAVRVYRDYVGRYRSNWYKEQFSRWGDGEVVVSGIMERLQPQFNLMDNAEWLHAQPMLWLEPHWRYFKLCAEASESRLKREGIVSDKTLSTVRALNSAGLRWLGNVPLDRIIELRAKNENESFRRKVHEFTAALHEASWDDIDRVAGEVSRGIASLLVEHQNEVRRIEEKYQRHHKVTASLSWVTLAAQFLPWLFPGLPEIPATLGTLATPAFIATKYMTDKIHERGERKEASRSLTGILAAARE